MESQDTIQSPDQIEFVDIGRPRSEVVTLEWPVRVGVQIIDRVTVRRMTTAQMIAFAENSESDKRARFPMFDVPAEVLDHLDPDDDERLSEVVARFLPRRFQLAESPSENQGAPSP